MTINPFDLIECSKNMPLRQNNADLDLSVYTWQVSFVWLVSGLINTDNDLQKIVCTLNSVDYDNEIGFGNWQEWIVNTEFKEISMAQINDNITQMIDEINEKIKENSANSFIYHTMLFVLNKIRQSNNKQAFCLIPLKTKPNCPNRLTGHYYHYIILDNDDCYYLAHNQES
ncbi:Uncharacterised protein [Moraxella lacunata]|uniref:Uncharacterized protein n=1 Tax=Moraxella lacunata TaxID=477 RepID=A0A378TS76_MORLA|nr:hypothetical protein [Moraxella lacunata]STZ63124.1 Uncharacterised protein [Moraxella lacunata]